MTIAYCPGCQHQRDTHDRHGICHEMVEAVTAGGENHLTLCGSCRWVPVRFESGTRGWRHVEDVDRGQVEIESETLAQALDEVARIMGFK